VCSRSSKEEQAIMKEDSFIRQAMIVASVSVLLEIFGHLYISMITSVGYFYYIL
jgi:hypothetical protein